ncbi:hypothetical protein ACWEWU_11780 [Staphylococcus xylosus]
MVEIKTIEGNKETSETVNIKEMNIFQIKRIAKHINSLVKQVNANEHLQNAVQSYSDKRKALVDENEKLYRQQLDEDKEDIVQLDVKGEAFKQVGSQFYNDVLGSFEILLENAPETLHQVLAEASGIDEKKLSEQNAFTLMDVIDEVVEVNDIPRLIERLKKSKASLVTVMNAVFQKSKTTN